MDIWPGLCMQRESLVHAALCSDFATAYQHVAARDDNDALINDTLQSQNLYSKNEGTEYLLFGPSSVLSEHPAMQQRIKTCRSGWRCGCHAAPVNASQSMALVNNIKINKYNELYSPQATQSDYVMVPQLTPYMPPLSRIKAHIRGIGGVSEVVRPKVGTAEGRFGGGSGGPPPGNFCKKDTKSCVLGTSGTLLAQFIKS